MRTLKTTCGLCSAGCGMIVHLENDIAVKISGNADNPVNRGVLCAKGNAALEIALHPDRLKSPLRRKGKKGDGSWDEISWAEAFSIIAGNFKETAEKYGSEAVAFILGSSKGLTDVYVERLANVFGTPNIITSGHVCFLPRFMASKYTYGFYSLPDYEGPPACIINWGANFANTRLPEHSRTIKALNKGAKLIVIDPAATPLSKRSNIHLKIKPGADQFLALGMINVIITETLYDRQFVSKYTTGFNRLKKQVMNYSPELISGLTWIAPEKIRETARLYATQKPGCIQWGNAIDHNENSFQTARAISILRAITGNIDTPGGDIEPVHPLSALGSTDITMWNQLPEKKWKKRIAVDHHLLPAFHRNLPRNIYKAILEEKPYPVKSLYIHSANPLITWDNSEMAYNAISRAGFTVVSDFFMTPTAALADIVLPAATFLEFDNIATGPYYPAAQIQQQVLTVESCRSDFHIVSGLAKQLGLSKYFHENIEDFFNEVLSGTGIDFGKLKKTGIFTKPQKYEKYIDLGFNTPSRKIELYSRQLEILGYEPVPQPEIPESFSAAAKNPNDDHMREYPLILTSGKSGTYIHSGHRQIKSLRSKHPEPIVKIHPATAEQFFIKYCDLVYIETKKNRIIQKAELSEEIDPRVIIADFGWWFPETELQSRGLPDNRYLSGFKKSNINLLTDEKSQYSREAGSGRLRGLPCRIYKK